MSARRCPHGRPDCDGPNGLCADCSDDIEYRVWTRHDHQTNAEFDDDGELTLMQQLREDWAFALCLLGLVCLFVWLAGSTP